MDTLLYDTSIPYISSLQSTFTNQASFMQLMSVVFDPKYAFLIYSPLAYLIDHNVGLKLIMTTVIAEWLNMILKWLLHGERPYWYVHSSGHFNPEEVPIKQFPITCELGPGHPSGHSMVTAAVWYIIVDSLVKYINQNQGQQSKTNESTSETQISNNKANYTLWTLYGVLLMTVGVSRVFLACHFPHQCLAGGLLGLLVARLVSNYSHLIKPSHFVLTSILMLSTAFGTFQLLQALGLDPSWTIRLATKHCEKREYIHIDTAPFFSIMRYCGFALGTGLALYVSNFLGRFSPVEAARLLINSNITLNTNNNSPIVELSKTQRVHGGKVTNDKVKHQEPLSTINEALTEDQAQLIGTTIGEKPLSSNNSNNPTWLSAKILMALLMARLVDNLGLFVSHSNMILFYSSAFMAYTGFSFAFVNL